MRCATAPPIAPSPTTSTREPAMRRLPSAPMASCAHSRAAWLRNACGSRRKQRERDREHVLRDRVRRHPSRVRDDDRTRDHLGKQHPADAGRRAVEPPQASRAPPAAPRVIWPRRRPRRRRSAAPASSSVRAWRNVCAGNRLPQAIDVARSGMRPDLRTGCGCTRGWSRPVVAAPATTLLDQPDLADDHRLVHRLDHVVDGQRGDGDRRQRLHLDARASRRADPGLDARSRRGPA